MTRRNQSLSSNNCYIPFSRLYKGLHEEFAFKGASADTHRYVATRSKLPDSFCRENGITCIYGKMERAWKLDM